MGQGFACRSGTASGAWSGRLILLVILVPGARDSGLAQGWISGHVEHRGGAASPGTPAFVVEVFGWPGAWWSRRRSFGHAMEMIQRTPVDTSGNFRIARRAFAGQLVLLVRNDEACSYPIRIDAEVGSWELGRIRTWPLQRLRGRIIGDDAVKAHRDLRVTTSGGLHPYGWRRLDRVPGSLGESASRRPGTDPGANVGHDGEFEVLVMPQAVGALHFCRRYYAPVRINGVRRAFPVLKILRSADVVATGSADPPRHLDHCLRRQRFIARDDAGRPAAGVEIYQEVVPDKDDYPWLRWSTPLPRRVPDRYRIPGAGESLWALVGTTDCDGRCEAILNQGRHRFAFKKPGFLIIVARAPEVGALSVRLRPSSLTLDLIGVPHPHSRLEGHWEAPLEDESDPVTLRRLAPGSPLLDLETTDSPSFEGRATLTGGVPGRFLLRAEIRDAQGVVREVRHGSVELRGPMTVSWSDLAVVDHR